MTLEQKKKLCKRIDKILGRGVEHGIEVDVVRDQLIKELNLYNIQTLINDKDQEIKRLKAL